MFSISQCLSKRYQILNSILSNEDTMVIQEKSKQATLDPWIYEVYSLGTLKDDLLFPLSILSPTAPHLSLNSSFTILSLEEGDGESSE